MRGYGRDYDRDYGRWMSGGSQNYRDRMRHNPSWEGRGYDAGGGYRGGRPLRENDWRRRTYEAGGGRGYDLNDYGRGDYTHGDFSRPNRGVRGRGRSPGQPSYFDWDAARYGMGGYGVGSNLQTGSFMNPTTRGDYFLGYGAATKHGYSPFW